ncbi:hypothetical protein ACH5RR_028957 [Cinchona calisaya]|uniref:Uncharacterized protein n=1 Tax=Cinchona calisaya TaxID=153742 RepID=A0ABD2YQA0_9GENT
MAGPGKRGNACARSKEAALLTNVLQDQADDTTIQASLISIGLPSTTTGRQQADCSSNSIRVGSNHSIGCASNNVEEIEELLKNENDMTSLKKKRGPTRNIALSKKRKAPGGVKTKVDVSEES